MAEKTTFIKLDRNIMRWKFYKNSNVMRVFIHLLLNANIKPGKVMGVIVERGQIATSYNSLALALGISYKQARAAIETLESAGALRHQSFNKFSLITVLNYDHYQGTAGKRAGKPQNLGTQVGRQEKAEKASNINENFSEKSTLGQSSGHPNPEIRAGKRATIKEYKKNYKELKNNACARENPSSSAALEAQTPWAQRGMTEAEYEAWRNQ